MKKKHLKCIFCVLLAVCLVASLFGCGASYRNDVAAQDIMAAIIEVLSEQDGEYYTAGNDTYDIYFGDNAAYGTMEDCCIAYHSVGTNVDQIGVFRVKEGQSVEPVHRMVQEYADGQAEYLHGFAANYNREELDKIQNQQVERIGQYVIFTILGTEDAREVMETVKKMISK